MRLWEIFFMFAKNMRDFLYVKTRWRDALRSFKCSSGWIHTCLVLVLTSPTPFQDFPPFCSQKAAAQSNHVGNLFPTPPPPPLHYCLSLAALSPGSHSFCIASTHARGGAMQLPTATPRHSTPLHTTPQVVRKIFSELRQRMLAQIVSDDASVPVLSFPALHAWGHFPMVASKNPFYCMTHYIRISAL